MKEVEGVEVVSGVVSFSKDQLWSWLDGQMHVIYEGRDYPAGTPYEVIRKRLRQAAWRRAVTVRLVAMGDKVMIQSSEDSNQFAEQIRAMHRPPRPVYVPTPQETVIQEQQEEIARLQLLVQVSQEEFGQLAREFSAYRLAHPVR